MVSAAESDSLPLNANLDVAYVGSEKCVNCHQEQHGSFLQTLHSKAARRTDVSLEPAPTSFVHDASGHRYSVEVADESMVHREEIRDPTGASVAKIEQQMVMTLGSGTHAMSYLSQQGPFHVQSPITYFQDQESWSMSPGYDVPVHRSFRRTASTACVFCHVGSINQINENPYKFQILESRIGCERCHGPGELHVKRHEQDPNWSDDPAHGHDTTIVNPDSLSRDLSEAICQQCHCQGIQAINVSGKNEWQFRPGQALTDFRVDFQFQRGDNAMRLVGHVEQMHNSKCYTETETLTCISCHDPHDPPQQDQLAAYYRTKCYQCHEDRACGKPIEDRNALHQNDCVQCHMPKGDTNVSHFALHDHRIGIHTEQADRSTKNAESFTSILNVSHLPHLEQQRLQGLAKYEIHRRFGGIPKFSEFDVEAIAELIQVKQGGLQDPDVDAALVWLAWGQRQVPIAEDLAKQILATEKGESMPRIVATNIMAQIAFQRQDFKQSLAYYRLLDGYHRDSRDIYYLGLVEQNNKNTERAIEALKRSIEIDPAQTGSHVALQAIYQSTGRIEEAKQHEQAAVRNRSLQLHYSNAEKRLPEQVK